MIRQRIFNLLVLAVGLFVLSPGVPSFAEQNPQEPTELETYFDLLEEAEQNPQKFPELETYFDLLGEAEQNPQEPTELETYFDLLEEEKVPITTGASRPLTKKKMPATVTVITADEIKLLGLRHLTDVINYIVPGGIADIHRSTRTGLYCFRGITADDNGKYVFMVDGLNVSSNAIWGAFNERYIGLLDELDRIEITQGVGSTLYGSGAISGVINFITKTGNTFQGAEITSGFGSGRKFEETIKFGKKMSDDRHDFFYFGYKKSRGMIPKGGSGDSTTNPGRKEHAGSGRRWDHFAPSFKFHTNIQRGNFSLRARYVQDKFEEPFTSEGHEDWNTADEYWFHNWFFIQPEVKYELSKNSRIKANLAFAMDEMGNEKIKDWWKSGNLNCKEGNRRLTKGERKIRGRFFHYYDGWTNHKLTSGAELFWMHLGPDFRGDNYTIPNSGIKQRNIKTENTYFAAVFFEDMWQINEKSTFFAGVRVENHIKTPVSISPRAAISHKVDEKTDVKFMYNTGYRTPPWGYFWGNEKLNPPAPKPEPEKVQSFEAHILHSFTPRFSTSLVGYYTIYKDLINYWSGSGYGYYNFPEVKTSGLELTGDYRGEDLKLKFSHSFSRPVHFSDNNYDITYLSYNRRDWAQFPTHLSKAQAIINLVEDKCILGLTYMRHWGIKGQRNADSKLKNAAGWLNATLTFKLKKDLEFQVSGYNLTEEDSPWWGAYTYDGVSRDIIPHIKYFVKLIWRF